MKFNKTKALIINGTLVARGTSDDKIIFTSNTDTVPGSWGYISFTDTSTDATFDPNGNYTGGCIIQYAIVQYGGSGKSVITINASSPFLDNSTIENNTMAGISVTTGVPLISNCEIRSNFGGGISLGVGSSSTIKNCVISENPNSGISAKTCNILIQNSTISANAAASYGGGVYASSSTVTIQNSTISANEADSYGGGVYASSSTVTIQNSTISTNTAGSYGGGVYASYSTVTVQDSTLNSNIAGAYGGGICAYYNSTVLTVLNSVLTANSAPNGGGIYSDYKATIEGSTFKDNSALKVGGAIYVSGTAKIKDNILTKGNFGNVAPSGGAIYASGTVTLQKNEITQNMAPNPFGCVLRLVDISSDSIIGGSEENANIIKDNFGDGVYFKGAAPINYNDIYNNGWHEFVSGNPAGSDIDATNNYWGTTDESKIEEEIWDCEDDDALGCVTYKPFLTAPIGEDSIVPSAVTDLATSDPTVNSITLTWTAPGDDGDIGTASQYDIRYSTTLPFDWDTATPCTGEPKPKPTGEPETFTVTDLSSGTTYYFAMKTADEVPNWSELSNVATGTTSGGVGAINGYVTDAVTGKPIPKAIVIAKKGETKAPPAFTNKDGYYEIKDLQVGEWQLICIKKGYKAGFAKVIVESGKTTTKDFKLKPKSGEDDEDEFTDLYANYPNPFNPDTWIPYSLSKDADVTIRIYNGAGQLVRILVLGRQVAGIYIDKDKAAYWDGKDDLGQQVASGVYYYTLRAGNFSATRKMVIIK